MLMDSFSSIITTNTTNTLHTFSVQANVVVCLWSFLRNRQISSEFIWQWKTCKLSHPNRCNKTNRRIREIQSSTTCVCSLSHEVQTEAHLRRWSQPSRLMRLSGRQRRTKQNHSAAEQWWAREKVLVWCRRFFSILYLEYYVEIVRRSSVEAFILYLSE